MLQLDFFAVETRRESDVRGDYVNQRRPRAPARSRAPAHARPPAPGAPDAPADPTLFRLEEHACRHCGGGRLVSQAVAGGMRRYVCSNCEAEATGPSPAMMCFCGLQLPKRGGRQQLLACHRNPSPSPDFPSAVVASETPPKC